MTTEYVDVILFFSKCNHPNMWLQVLLENTLGKIHIIHVIKHCRIFVQGGTDSLIHSY